MIVAWPIIAGFLFHTWSPGKSAGLLPAVIMDVSPKSFSHRGPHPRVPLRQAPVEVAGQQHGQRRECPVKEMSPARG